MNQSVVARQQLKDAFELFNEVSEQLTSSYQVLQRQVVALEHKLADSRCERLRLLDQIQTLHQEIGRTQRLSSIGEMTARLSHQIRTPLATALLYASQLKEAKLRKEQHDCFVDRLLVGLRHLDHMVNDMLVFARGGQGGGDAVSVSKLLEQVRQTLLPRLEECNAGWSVETPGENLLIRGNEEILTSVLGNLATNALDACGRDAVLEWTVATAGTGVRLVLQDNGPGIPADLSERVFEPFFTTRSNGTGLGLAVVRAVIDAHQGSIEIDPSSAGGARFVIRLPLFRTNVQLPSEMMHKRNKANNANSRCV